MTEDKYYDELREVAEDDKRTQAYWDMLDEQREREEWEEHYADKETDEAFQQELKRLKAEKAKVKTQNDNQTKYGYWFERMKEEKLKEFNNGNRNQ